MDFDATRLVLPLVLLTIISVQPAASQSAPTGPGLPPPGGLVVKVGLEPQLVVSLEYLWDVDTGDGRSKVGVGAGAKVSPYLLREGAGRLNLIVAGQWQPDPRWGATGTSHLYLVRSRNRAATAHGFGMEARLAPGRQGERWGLAADLGWQGTLLTHVRHREAARETFEERHLEDATGKDGPVDGWYGSTAQRFRIGLLNTRRVREGVHLQAAVGSLFSVQRQGILIGFAHGQVPAYFETSVRWVR